jgi:hypothetical protein
VPNDPFADLGRIFVGVAHGPDPDRRAILANVVDDLLDELRKLVDRQAGSTLGRPSLLDLIWPLIAIIAVTGCEFEIVDLELALLRFGIDGPIEPFQGDITPLILVPPFAPCPKLAAILHQ